VRRQRNTSVWLDDAIGLDAERRTVLLTDGSELAYDTLIVATGVTHHYFGHDDWERYAPGLKTLEDATEIRRRVLSAFEAAERAPDTAFEDGWLTFVIVGAGPTGVELAGAIAELARHTMRRDFRAIDPSRARVILIEGTDRVLPQYPASLSERARRSLERLGVTVRTGGMVTDLDERHVTVGKGDSAIDIATRTVLWAAGVGASSFAAQLAEATGAETDRAGRIVVEPDLTIPGHPEILVIGDLARFTHQTGEPLHGVAPVAIQEGRYAARAIARRLSGKDVPPFHYFNKGELATIGRAAAVANFGKLRFSGYPAWLLWLFVHLMYLVGFENRLLVFVQWAWSYVTRHRGTRLIAHGWSGKDR